MIENLWTREQEFINVINAMECRGVKIDQPMCSRESAIGEARMKNISEELDCNPGSTKDLKVLLIDKLGLPVVKPTPKGAPSFDKEAMAEYDTLLEHQQNPLAKKIFEYRGWQKSHGYYESFLKLVDPDSRIRTSYWIHGTQTGRLSSRTPNLQQIPRSSSKPWNGRMKEVFLPPDDYRLLNVDYGQLEFRLAAAYSREPILLDAFNDPKRHVFKEMSALLGLEYTQCKTATYAILYGAQIPKVGAILGFDPDRAAKFSDDWYNTYPKLMETAQRVNYTAARRGYIKYWSGRRRHFPDRRDSRKAFNSLLQGGGAEVVKSAMIRVKKRIDREGYYSLLLQVHDSLVGEARISEMEEITALIQHEMCNIAEEHDFGVRFTAEADFWGPKVAA